MLKAGKEKVAADLILQIPIKVHTHPPTPTPHPSPPLFYARKKVYGSSYLWRDFIEKLVENDSQVLVLNVLEDACKSGGAQHKQFFESIFSFFLKLIIGSEEKVLLPVVLDTLTRLEYKVDSLILRDVFIVLIQEKTAFKDIKRYLLNHIGSMDEPGFTDILRKYS